MDVFHFFHLGRFFQGLFHELFFLESLSFLSNFKSLLQVLILDATWSSLDFGLLIELLLLSFSPFQFLFLYLLLGFRISFEKLDGLLVKLSIPFAHQSFESNKIVYSHYLVNNLFVNRVLLSFGASCHESFLVDFELS